MPDLKLANNFEYSVTIPDDAALLTITAKPSVTRTFGVDGEQSPGQVHIFGTNYPRNDARVGESGLEFMFDLFLSKDDDDFTFFVEVSVPVVGDDPVREIYSLTLTRALPAIAELLVFRADDGDRQNPLNDGEVDDTLRFGPEDDEMELVFVLSDGVYDYSISELLPSGFDSIETPIIITSSSDGGIRGFRVEIDPEGTRTLETKVTLSRVLPRDEDFEFSLAFEAMSPRPIAEDADASLLSTDGVGLLR